jgi:hypothetical protein
MRFHFYSSLMTSYLAVRTFAVPQDDLFATSSLFQGSPSPLEGPLSDDSPDLFDTTSPDIKAGPAVDDVSLSPECSAVGTDPMIGKNKSRKRGSVCLMDDEADDHDQEYWETFNLNRQLLQRSKAGFGEIQAQLRTLLAALDALVL